VSAIEAGAPARDLAGMAKLNAAEATARIVDRGMRAMGAMGLAEESAMQMYFRDARLQLFSPVSNEMIRNVLGEALGLGRSY
jgi:alkylation response protein AidB-like acyl-CoA dehydrogenase